MYLCIWIDKPFQVGFTAEFFKGIQWNVS